MNKPIAFYLCLTVTALSAAPRTDPYFQITVVDQETGRGVPMIELRTVNNLKYYTDNAGVVAFHEPGWMDQTVFFYVSGHGYEFPKDAFGFRGVRLKTETGGSAVVKIKRINIAERLYRVTGGGLFVESQRVGLEAPITAPLRAQVIGSDSVQAGVFQGRLHWFWGDTNRPAYPLGNFDVPGATSKLPADGGLDPSIGVDLNYFLGPEGFAKATCKMPGKGPTWLDGIAVVKDIQNRERMFGHFLKIEPPLRVYQQGLAEFLPEKQEFESRCLLPEDSVIPSGHSFQYSESGVDYVCFAKPFSVVRTRATAESVLDPTQYEAFTCLVAGSRAEDLKVERDGEGRVVYGWKRNSPAMDSGLQTKLVAAGQLKPAECLFQVCDVQTGKPVAVHAGSLNWNEFRHKWIFVATQSAGTSMLGEVWYAEADTPAGPWAYARKIVTHDRQSFYNPRHHAFFDQQAGRVIFFEGTYTHTFSGNDERTPRYDYNQMMHRLDLADARLRLPVAIRREITDQGEQLLRVKPGEPEGVSPRSTIRDRKKVDSTFRDVLFFACDQPFPNSKPFFLREDGGLTVVPPEGGANSALFHAVVSEAEKPSACEPLFEYTDMTGQKNYRIRNADLPGFQRAQRPLCFVWPAPI